MMGRGGQGEKENRREEKPSPSVFGPYKKILDLPLTEFDNIFVLFGLNNVKQISSQRILHVTILILSYATDRRSTPD